MSNKNSNLQSAKNTKDDEFYTTYETVEKELSHYGYHFENRTVLCNCDDPYESNFCKYFLLNFNKLKLKRLICTSYAGSKMMFNKELYNGRKSKKQGYVLDVSSIKDFAESDSIIEYIVENDLIHEMEGNGDFRSDECVNYLRQSDIIVTNPPFSLFRELISLIMDNNKKFLLISNQNALTYSEIFPLIQNNIVWTGFQFGEMKFRVPPTSKERKTRFWIDSKGQKWRSLGNAMWLTNLDNEKRHQLVKMSKSYNDIDYPKYDNYDAINVKTINDIPSDYFGIMGVPITFMNRYNSEQFEIIGEANHGSDNEYDLFKPTINGKDIFKRILIKRKVQ